MPTDSDTAILLRVPETPFGETSDTWPDVLAVSADGKWRLARSRDERPATQWLVQLNRGEGRWHSRVFFQSGDALRAYRQDALCLASGKERRDLDQFFLDAAIGQAIVRLPETCPQREEALMSEAARAGKVAAAARMRATRKRSSDGL